MIARMFWALGDLRMPIEILKLWALEARRHLEWQAIF